MRRLPVFIIALALSAAAPAALYKWVDKDGNVTYSERKPPDAQAEELKLRGVPAVSNDKAQERLDAVKDRADAARKDREFKQNYTSETGERDALLKKNCETARQNLRVLETASRIKDAEGNYIDDTAREARLAQTRQEIEDNCP